MVNNILENTLTVAITPVNLDYKIQIILLQIKFYWSSKNLENTLTNKLQIFS